MLRGGGYRTLCPLRDPLGLPLEVNVRLPRASLCFRSVTRYAWGAYAQLQDFSILTLYCGLQCP